MKIIYTLSLLLPIFISFGQVEIDSIPLLEDASIIVDSIEIDEDDSKPEFQAHWNSFDIGFGFLKMGDNAAYPFWKSTEINLSHFAFNMMEYKLPVFKQYLGLTTGMGFGFTSIMLKQYDLIHTDDSLFAIQNTVQDYKNNSMTFFTLTVPLLIEICNKADTEKGFFMDMGMVGYWNMGGSWNTKGKLSNGDRFQNAVTSMFEMRTFGAFATARIGFDYFSVFANYNLTPLFKSSATLPVYPITLGLNVNFDY